MAQVTVFAESRTGVGENVMMKKKRVKWRRRRRRNHRADSARLCGHEEEPRGKKWKII